MSSGLLYFCNTATRELKDGIQKKPSRTEDPRFASWIHANDFRKSVSYNDGIICKRWLDGTRLKT